MFADSGLSDEMVEKIVAFVDREAGRDAPLTADDEAMVRRLIADDPAARALADELRATNAGLDTLLDDVAAVDVPENLVALIQGHAAKEIAAPAFGRAESDGAAGPEGHVVDMQPPAVRRRSYGPLAAAASIAMMIASGALYQVYTTSEEERARLQAELAAATNETDASSRALADAEAEIRRLAGLADQASTQRRETADRLAANEEAIQQLEVERATLEGRYAALEGDHQALNEQLERQRTLIADSEAARDRVAADLAEARETLALAESSTTEVETTLTAEVEDLTARLDRREQELAALAVELEAGKEQSKSARAGLAEAQGEKEALERQLTTAESDRQQLLAEREVAEQAASLAEQQLASLEAAVQNAESRLATVAAGLASAEAGRREAVQQVVGLEADLAASRSWLGQIAQYHRVYASTARRHLVEVGADELDHIQNWLTNMLERQILVPDLTAYGVTFAGARLLGINEKPVAQLVYLDANDQPLALCIIPSTGAAKNPTASTNGELNLIDWRDGRHGYAVVGWSDPDLLASLTQAIQPVYDL
ncbi:MAG: hypothetical protein AAF543_00065 [Pseudomonadota bacterium]